MPASGLMSASLFVIKQGLITQRNDSHDFHFVDNPESSLFFFFKSSNLLLQDCLYQVCLNQLPDFRTCCWTRVMLILPLTAYAKITQKKCVGGCPVGARFFLGGCNIFVGLCSSCKKWSSWVPKGWLPHFSIPLPRPPLPRISQFESPCRLWKWTVFIFWLKARFVLAHFHIYQYNKHHRP